MSAAMRHTLFLPALFLAWPALAQDIPADLARLEVLPGWRTAEGRHMAALRVTLAPGWKTYWRAPGAAGLPPQIDLAASTGIAGAELRWPVPEVFDFNGMRSIGYHDAVTIPLDLSLEGGPARLEGAIEIGVCHDICVPVRFPFALDLPEGGDRDPVIAAALVDRPMTPEEAGARATCTLAPEGEGLALTVSLSMPPLGPDEAVVIETADPALWVSEATASREGGTLVATAEALARDGGPAAVDRSDLRITVLAQGRAVDIPGCAAG
jgi:DsbC/DsbD-like thiol-disulfide interchange protein